MAGWLEAQRRLQVEAFGIDPFEMTGPSRAEFVRWNVLAAEDELHEMLKEIKWKPWAGRQGEIADLNAYEAEIVDTLHFIGNLALVAGLTDEKLAEKYGIKLNVNFERQQREDGYDGVGRGEEHVGRGVDEGDELGAAGTEPPGLDVGLFSDVESIKTAFQRDERAAVRIDHEDEKEAKKSREMLYQAAYQLGGKAKVRSRKKDGIAVGQFIETNGDTPKTKPKQESTARPLREPAPPEVKKTHPLEGRTHVDRDGRGWIYYHESGGWTRHTEIDAPANADAPPAPSF